MRLKTDDSRVFGLFQRWCGFVGVLRLRVVVSFLRFLVLFCIVGATKVRTLRCKFLCRTQNVAPGVVMASIRERKKKDGSVSYLAEIRIKRGGEVVYRESETWNRRKLAEQWAAKRESALAEPRVLDRAIAGKAEKPLTVAELIHRYVEVVFPLSPWGRSKEALLKQILRSDFAGLVAEDVMAADIIDYCRSLPAGPATVNQHYVYIRGIWSVARDLLRVDVQWAEIDAAQRTMSKLGIIAKSAERDRRPTIDEMTKIVSYLHRRRREQLAGRHRYRDDLIAMDKVAVFAMFSSRRQEEIVRINRTDTDYERQRVLIRAMKHPTKKEAHDVWCYVPDEAWRVMLSMPQKEGDDRWFPYFSRSIGDRFRAVLKELGMWVVDDDGDSNLHFHDLRHECASWLFERDGFEGQRWDVPRVASVTGHQSWNSLKRYTQIENSVPNDKWKGWVWAEKVCD